MNKLNVANVLAYVVNTFVTFISMTGIFGLTNGEVSAKYQTIITPAGWAFSIWGIIFTGELAFVVAQCFSSVKDSDLVQKGVSWGWVSASLFQCAWTFAFAQEQLILSTVFITGIFLSLAAVVARSAQQPRLDSTAADLVCRLPLTLHFGWLAAAAALNVNLVVVQQGGSAAEQLGCGLTSLALVLALATTLALGRGPFVGRAVPAAVACWALAAIASELSSPMDEAQCEAATGSPDQCNMISVLFDDVSIAGVQNTARNLSYAAGAISLLGAVAGCFSAGGAAAAAASSSSLPSTAAFQTSSVKSPLI
jgi:hypothetical protein